MLRKSPRNKSPLIYSINKTDFLCQYTHHEECKAENEESGTDSAEEGE